jgi:DNA repair exonuclease SbcCD nuclease subunit
MADCFIHASDLHLDAPLGRLGRLGEEARQRLAAEAGEAWSSLVDLTITEGASFLVLAGDIFHKGVGNAAVQRNFHDGLRRLETEGIKVLMCHGNHDPLTADFKRIGPLPGNVEVFRTGSPEIFEVPLRKGGAVSVSGLSFGQKHETDNLAKKFRQLRPTYRPHVAVLHANLGGDKAHDPYAPCEIKDLVAAPVDYWALGHIHLRQLRELAPNRYAAYCGNLQGRHSKECDSKGAYVVPVEDGQIREPKFVACDRVRFVHDDIQVEPEDDIEAIIDRIDVAARHAAAVAERRPVVWSLTLKGRHRDPSAIRGLLDLDDKNSQDALGGGDLAEILNGGGLARAKSLVTFHRSREELIAEGGVQAMILKALDDDAVRSTLERLVAELPTAIPRQVLTVEEEGPAVEEEGPTGGEEGPDINDLLEQVVPLAGELLVALLGESSG